MSRTSIVVTTGTGITVTGIDDSAYVGLSPYTRSAPGAAYKVVCIEQPPPFRRVNLTVAGHWHPHPPAPQLVASTFSWAAVAYHAAAFFSKPQSDPDRRRLSIMRSAKELAERRFQQKEEGAKALTDYQAKEHATRLLTAKLRAERLARESKPHGSERHS